MQPARPLLILLHIVTYRRDSQYAVEVLYRTPHHRDEEKQPAQYPVSLSIGHMPRMYASRTRRAPASISLSLSALSSLRILLNNYSHEDLAIVVPRIPSASARLQPYAEPQNATAIPLPMLPLLHPRQCLREIDSEQTYAYRDLRPDVDRK
ncbi:hypothetical protein CFIO01_13489 [Colletotrichum fioriniae PJ7]|uniref:Uncharacterized protein n=1 Tax=Colletotrichum fioriniae PJ7 TaxID=1445577 RepID=A0A010RN29_9PEZI|nr:hypothetical protein CFIO01_13489 [Colletotrichum fioriniae PJ7]